MKIEENCTLPPSPTTTPTSQQELLAKTLPSQYFPGQNQIQSLSQAARLPRGRGRGRSTSQTVPSTSALARLTAPGAPRPGRLHQPRMVRPSPPPRIRQIRPRLSEHPGFKSQQRTRSIKSPYFRPKMSAGLLSNGSVQCVPFTSEPKSLRQPLVVELDSDLSSPQHDHHAVAPINLSTMSMPDLVLPPGISIIRNPHVSGTDADTVSDATHLTSLAKALVKVGDTGGKRYLALYEVTESQIQGLRERRII